MIVVDALKRGQRPTIIVVFSDSYPPLNPVVLLVFLSTFGQTMDLATPTIGLHRTP